MARCGLLVGCTVCATLGVPAVAGPPATMQGVLKEVEPNDDFGSVQTVPPNCDVKAAVSYVHDSDCFTFKIEKPIFIRASVTAVPGVDFRFTLYDADQAVLQTVNGQGAGKPEQMLRRLRRGTYCLQVIADAEGGVPAKPAYTLELRETTLLQYEPSIEQIKAAIKRGLAWLAKKQEADGHWEAKAGPHGITGLALMAFVGEKLPEFEKQVEKAAAYFKKDYVPPGTFKDNPDWEMWEAQYAGSFIGKDFNGVFMYEQAIATLAMAEYVQEHKDDKTRAMVAEAVKLIIREQNTAAKPKTLNGPVTAAKPHFGGWRYRPESEAADLSASGWCLIALAAAEKAGFKIPENVRKDFMVLCRKCFNEQEVMYAYAVDAHEITNTTNAVGVLTTLMCVGGNCSVLRPALSSMRQNFPVWEEEGHRGKYPLYYWYYASRAMYVAGGDYWKEWQAAILPLLLDHQNADGSWEAAQEESEERGVGKFYTTALAILILQLCSGNPPAYLEGLSLERVTYACDQCVSDIEDLVKAAGKDNRSKEQLLKDLKILLDRYRGE